MMDAMERKKSLKIGGKIERVNGKELSYAEFVERYMSKNQPVVITGLMDDWRACKDWVDESGKPNLRFFSTHFGKSKVQVADCGIRECAEQKCLEMSVSEFIEHWLALYNEVVGDKSAKKHDYESLLYLKDWHFVKEYPEYVAYETPLFFHDDWLNLYLDNFRMHNDPDVYSERNEISCSDYRFVYMGPKGTWTPLHADVFMSYSWSANVCGRKLWLFLPPSQHHLIFDRYMKNSVCNILENVDEVKFPRFKQAEWLECIQEGNELLFVPSGWYHQVHNLEDTISINHNWFNAYNLSWVWDVLQRDYKEAKDLIEDIRDVCDDFESLCQRNLAANTGMNFYDFFAFVRLMSFAYIVELYIQSHACEISSWSSCSWAQHILLNLSSIRRLAMKMNSTCVEKNCGNSLDLMRILGNPAFLQLCESLGSMHKKLHADSSRKSYQIQRYVTQMAARELNGINTSNFQVVSTFEDLVRLIDCAVRQLDCLRTRVGLVSERHD